MIHRYVARIRKAQAFLLYSSFHPMTPIQTYVFVDLETTGLPSEENNRTKITELSMVAVRRGHVLDTRPGASPRVQHKLTLCFNPGRLIQPSCTDVTGLSNDLLEHETPFNMQVFQMINNFLNVLSKPVCLVAQNGHRFDFPILKNHLEKLNVNFDDELLCADCYHAFFDIMEGIKQSSLNGTQVTDTNHQKDQETPKTPHTNQEINGEDELFTAENTLAMKAVNETTPKQQIKVSRIDRTKVSKARRRFPWSKGSKPAESYKLEHVYERLLNRPSIEAHRAENDCIMALECSVVLCKQFVTWVDENHVPFSEIKPMTIGVRLGE